MNEPRSRRTLIALLVAAWAVIDLVLLTVAPWYAQQQGLSEAVVLVVVLGCFFAQCATLAGWLPLGDGRLMVRGTWCIAAFFALQGLFWLFNPSGESARSGAWFAMGSAFFLMVLLPLAGLRVLGFRCQLRDAPEGGVGRLQFSILQILLVTTGTAVVLAIFKRVPWETPGGSLGEFFSIIFTLAAIAWITWLSMFRLPGLIGIVTTVVVAPLLGLIAGSIEGAEYWPWLGFTLLIATGLAVNLLVLRQCGYELTRGSQAAMPAESES